MIVGVSGTGFVAIGLEWPSGKVSIEWTIGDHISQESHNSLEDCMAIHGHNKHTIVVWIDNIDLNLLT